MPSARSSIRRSIQAPRRPAARVLPLPILFLALFVAVGCGDVVVSGGDTTGGADTGGGGGEPVTCGQYCDQVMSACGSGGATAQYVSRNACVLFCQSWAGLPLGTTAATSGNSAGCRLYHATVAGQTDPTLHCPHAGPTGANTCGTWCENYCHLALRNCTGDFELFTSEDACMAACAAFPTDGAPGDDRGDSVQCRLNALALAGAEPPATAARNCPDGAPDGGAACVD